VRSCGRRVRLLLGNEGWAARTKKVTGDDELGRVWRITAFGQDSYEHLWHIMAFMAGSFDAAFLVYLLH
jgi:hypothetical protein